MENDIFETMPVPKAYFKMSLPVVFGMAIGLVYNIVDTMFIARTQDACLVAGVSLCSPMFTLLIAFSDIFGLGGSSLIARLFGQNETERARNASAFCMVGSLLFGVAVSVLMLAFSNPVLRLLGAGPDTLPHAGAYYRFLMLGAPAILFNLVPGNLLRTEGLAMCAMLGSVLGAVVNIALDPVFIFALHLGAGGAAIATVLSNVISDLFLVGAVVYKSKHLSFSLRRARIPLSDVKAIFLIGIPASVTNVMQSLSVLLTNRHLASFGTERLAAMGIAFKVNMIALLIMVGFAFGAQPLLGYSYGRSDRKRLTKLLKFDIAVELAASLLFVFAALGCSEKIIALFMHSAQIVRWGSINLLLLTVTAPCVGVVLVLTTYFQAAGKALPAGLLSVSRQGIVFVVCLAVLSRLYGLYGIYEAQAVADVITLVLSLVLFVHTWNHQSWTAPETSRPQ